MRTRRTPPASLGLPLTALLLLASTPLMGCDKAEELADKVGGKEVEDKAKKDDDASAKDGADDKKDGADDGDDSKDAKDGGDEAKEPEAEPEAIPVEPLHTGLDLMLSFVPNVDAEYMIIRDASVVEEYYEEAMRFLDTPVEKLAKAEGLPPDVKDVEMGYDMARLKGKEIVEALHESGLRLKDGGALIKTKKGDDLLIFASDDPSAIGKLAEALGEKGMKEDACAPLEAHKGWSICAEKKSTLESYKPAEDPAAVRAALQARLVGVDLDEANMLADMEIDGERSTMAITTLPGLVHFAGVVPLDRDAKEGFEAMQPGPAHTLANVSPGAGFIWARTDAAMLKKAISSEMRGAPPQAKAVVDTFTGEWTLAGSVDPGGLVFQAGISDPKPYGAMWDVLLEASKDAPTEIPEIPGSKMTIEKMPITFGSTTAEAMHVGVTGVKEANILKAFAGIHADMWMFAANKTFTTTIGPDAEHVGKLLDSAGDGPSADMLSSLPAPLAAGFKRDEVSFAMHVPGDFMHGMHMHKLVRAALKNVPEANPEALIAAASTLAPLSSASMWIEEPSGSDHPVIHMAALGIGNRTTAEGKAALDAAHSVTEGTPPETAFKPLAEKYDNSAMAFAYHTRAGSEGPGSLVGSGIGAAVVTGAVVFATLSGQGNDALAEELGVKPEDPEPEIIPEHKPGTPEMKPVEPETDGGEDKGDGKTKPVPVEPKDKGKDKGEDKGDGKTKPVPVEPKDKGEDKGDGKTKPDPKDGGSDKPKPPIPTPDGGADKKKGKKKKKKGKKKKGKKKKKG